MNFADSSPHPTAHRRITMNARRDRSCFQPTLVRAIGWRKRFRRQAAANPPIQPATAGRPQPGYARCTGWFIRPLPPHAAHRGAAKSGGRIGSYEYKDIKLNQVDAWIHRGMTGGGSDRAQAAAAVEGPGRSGPANQPPGGCGALDKSRDARTTRPSHLRERPTEPQRTNGSRRRSPGRCPPERVGERQPDEAIGRARGRRRCRRAGRTVSVRQAHQGEQAERRHRTLGCSGAILGRQQRLKREIGMPAQLA